MGGTGQATSGFNPMGQSGGSFLSGMPWWVYVIVMVIGLGLSIFCFVKHSAARRRAFAPPVPGAPPPLAGAPPPGGGSGFLIGGLASAALLVLAPLVLMLIMQPWSGNWIVGTWSQRSGCSGRTIEFTSDGYVIAGGGRKPYRLEGNQITVEGRTETIQHNGDTFAVDGDTMYRCSGSSSTAASGSSSPFAPAPSAPSPSPYAAPPPSPSMPSSTPPPSYASWLIGRWSDSNCQRAMEFRADGTATTATGQPATYTTYPNGAGIHITINSGGRQIAGYMDQTTSGAVLRAYRPTSQTVNLIRC